MRKTIWAYVLLIGCFVTLAALLRGAAGYLFILFAGLITGLVVSDLWPNNEEDPEPPRPNADDW